MTNPLIIRVREALQAVRPATRGPDIVSSGIVRGLRVEGSEKIHFTLELSPEHASIGADLLARAKAAAQQVPGVEAVHAVATTHNAGSRETKMPPSGHDNPLGIKKAATTQQAGLSPAVKSVILVASGKGGVGKSTVAANLATSLAQQGLKTGLLDADIYGPSLPTLFNLSEKPALIDGKIMPIEVYGVQTMSIGLIVSEKQALAWRGPMVMGAVRQLLNDVNWGALDVLIVDTPPGTGDVHLSLIQTKRISGAVIVSTPQAMALADVRRGAELFQKTGIPVFGLIENMAWLEDGTGQRTYLFGKGGAEAAAKDLNIPFLGPLPLMQSIREASDDGTPFVLNDDSAAEIFRTLSAKVAALI